MGEYGVIGPPQWDEVWIIAGGPSAKDFDLSRSDGHMLVAVNDGAHTEFKNAGPHFAVSFCSIDPDWILRHRTYLSLFPGERFLAVALDTRPLAGGIQGATYLKRSHEFGLSDDPEYVCTGGNSGYMAINVAYLKGAKVIHLVGYDMDDGSDKYRQWIPRFKTMLSQLEAKGVRVINENPESAIDAFEKSGEVHA